MAKCVCGTRTRVASELHWTAIGPKSKLLGFSRDGRWIASAGADGKPRIIESATGSVAVELPATGAIARLVFSGDGGRIAWLDRHRELVAFDLRSKSVLNAWRVADEDGTFNVPRIFLNEDGALAAAAIGKNVRIFEVGTGNPNTSLAGHEESINVVGFSRNGTRVVTGADDNSARLWDLQTGKEIAHLVGHRHNVTGAAFTPDQATVVTTSYFLEDTIFWNARTGERITSFEGSTHGDLENSFSKSGKFLAIGRTNHEISIIDLADFRIAKVLKGHENSVSSAVFGHDDRWIASAASDGTARVWDLVTGEQLHKFDGLQVGSRLRASFQASDKHILVSDFFKEDSFRLYAISPVLTMSVQDRR